MDHRTCTHAGCDRKHAARGLCNYHYVQARRINDPTYGRGTGRYTKRCEVCGDTYTTTRWEGRVCNAPRRCREFIDPRIKKASRVPWRQCDGSGCCRWIVSRNGRRFCGPDCYPSERVDHGPRLCGCCMQMFIPIRSSQRYCTPRCSARIHRANRKAAEKGAPGTLTPTEWGKALVRYQRTCAYCRQRTELQVEHVVPLCRNGTNDAANIVPSCAPCNNEKGTLTTAEWLASNRPRVAEGLVRDRHDGLWPTGRAVRGRVTADPCPPRQIDPGGAKVADLSGATA